MIRCGKTGAALLYGTKCVGCDCQLAGLADGGVIPPGTEAPRIMGFDLSSGPDRSATAYVRVGKDYGFVVEEIDLFGTTSAEQAEAMARHQRRMDDAIWRAMNVPPEHFNCRSRMDPRYGDGTRWTPPAQEIITDPNDRRGFDARPVRAA